MFIKKYKTCKNCGTEFPKTRFFFVRNDHHTKEEDCFYDICRQCLEKINYEKNWDNDKLICSICGKSFPESYFSKKKDNIIRNHRDYRCKECKRKQNIEARQKYSDEKMLKKTLQSRCLGAKDRAKQKNLPFDITVEFLLDLWNKQNGLCAISKIPMTYKMDCGRVFSNVSIDQIIQGKGYTKDNIQLVCMSVNQLKSDFDMDTVLYICKMITENNK